VVPDRESSADAADRIAYGILVAALEEGLVNTIRHALDVLKRFSAPAGILGEQWLSEQEGILGKREWSSLWSEVVGLIPLFGHPDHGHEPHPLSLIRHRDQFLAMSAPLDVA